MKQDSLTRRYRLERPSWPDHPFRLHWFTSSCDWFDGTPCWDDHGQLFESMSLDAVVLWCEAAGVPWESVEDPDR